MRERPVRRRQPPPVPYDDPVADRRPGLLRDVVQPLPGPGRPQRGRVPRGQPRGVHRQGQAVPRQLAAGAGPRLRPRRCRGSLDEQVDAGLPADRQGRPPWDLQKVVAAALDLVTDVPDVFTPELRERFDLLPVKQALRWIHGPDEWSQLGAAQKRFRFEEALVLQLVLARRRAAHREQGARARAGRPKGLLAAFDARLPWELPAASARSGTSSLPSSAATTRCTGCSRARWASGKTVVALRAMLQVVDSGDRRRCWLPPRFLLSSTPVRSRRCSVTSPSRDARRDGGATSVVS